MGRTVNVLRYGHWAGDRFVFEPPLLRQGIVVDDVDFQTTPAPEGMTREDVIVAVLRGRVEFIPAEPPTADMFALAADVGGEFGRVYTGGHAVPGAMEIQCIVCGRTGQTLKPPPKVVLCSPPCTDLFTKDPLRYLGDEPQQDDETQLKLVMGMPVDLTRVPEEDKAAYAALAQQGVTMTYYPGSIVTQCADCQTDVYVGPRSQQVLAADPSARVLCPVCIVRLHARAMPDDDDVQLTAINLGNTTGITRSY